MGNFSETQKQQSAKKTELKEKEKVSRETLGKYFFDLSKLTFTAMCLGGGASLVLDYASTVNWVLVLLGIFFSAIMARVGYIILKR